MDKVQQLIKEVKQARELFISSASNLTPEQSCFKPRSDVWSTVEITEHMVRAEQSGISGIWKALDGIRRNDPIWSGETLHKGLTIEEVIEKTWQTKEKVPEIAAPCWGGSISYWIASLRALQGVLEELGNALRSVNLEEVVYPHPISGPLDGRQRLEFLRFHLNRHRDQIELLKAHSDYPQIRQ
jgi:hypothetical protein